MRPLIFLFFFLSGFSALIYEVAWVRILSLTLGNTVYATSTVLAVFMGGLALGAWVGGKIAERTGIGQLKLYGSIELAVAIVAPLVTWILNVSPAFYASIAGALPGDQIFLWWLRLAFCAGILLIPCMLMGATLPAIVRYVEGHTPAARVFSNLYGLNTLGAAIGSIGACYLGFAYIGLNATVYCAAAINFVIAVAAILTRTSANVVQPQQANSAPVKLQLILLSALTGFTALAYEVLWTRMLLVYLTSLTYTFTLVVFTFLLGLALGSFVYQKLLAPRAQTAADTLRIFALCQTASALVSLLSLSLTPWIASVRNLWLFPAESGLHNMTGHLLFSVAVCFLCLLLPVTLIGTLFPALGALAAGEQKHASSSVGAVYAANTIGCVLGSIVSGLILIPTLGWFASFQWMFILSVATGLIALIQKDVFKHKWALAGVIPVMVAFALYARFVHWQPQVSPGCKLLRYAEDALGSMHVVEDPRMNGTTLVWNGSCLATTIPNSRRYMRLLGHLPMLLHEHPKDVLVGCFGTGTTAGAVALHPELEAEDIVELSPMVIGSSDLFAGENYNVLKRENVQIIIDDVRNYLLRTKKQYDVITFEPPPPVDAGTVNLYTQEFYELANRHLKRGGLLCQWVPMNACSGRLWKMMVATARSVFPYVTVWLPNTWQAILVCSNEPITMDFDRMQTRIERSPTVAASLSDVGLTDAATILSTFVLTGNALDQFVSELPITDDHPRLEFFLPYDGPMLTDLELEKPGRSQVIELAKKSHNSASFNLERFRNNLNALHCLRKVHAAASEEEGMAYLKQSLKLMPDNRWFRWVNQHPREAIRGEI